MMLIRKHMLSDTEANEKYDINGDGSVDIRDLVAVKKLMA